MKWRGATRQVFLKQISSVDFWTSSAQLLYTPSKANESNFKNLTLCKWSTIKVPEFRDNTTKKNLEKILDHTAFWDNSQQGYFLISMKSFCN